VAPSLRETGVPAPLGPNRLAQPVLKGSAGADAGLGRGRLDASLPRGSAKGRTEGKIRRRFRLERQMKAPTLQPPEIHGAGQPALSLLAQSGSAGKRSAGCRISSQAGVCRRSSGTPARTRQGEARAVAGDAPAGMPTRTPRPARAGRSSPLIHASPAKSGEQLRCGGGCAPGVADVELRAWPHRRP
jgi:hypothetical protein